VNFCAARGGRVEGNEAHLTKPHPSPKPACRQRADPVALILLEDVAVVVDEAPTKSARAGCLFGFAPPSFDDRRVLAVTHCMDLGVSCQAFLGRVYVRVAGGGGREGEGKV